MSKYGVFSSPYFPEFGPEKTPYLDTFHAVRLEASYPYPIYTTAQKVKFFIKDSISK